MAYWLARTDDQIATDWIRRFDPRFWTINFPRPMVAALTTGPADGMSAHVVFQRANDLAGIIWDSVDTIDHPLLRYATHRDYRGLRLSFDWQASGAIKSLDAVHGPTLTIEGRDNAGAPRTWYVRLWNYAQGTPTSATIRLDFDALEGGFLLPAEADPVWAGDIDRMFISLAPEAYDGVSTAPLASPQAGQVDLSAIDVDGAHAAIAIGDVMVPPHSLRMANGYDDTAHMTPARLLRNWLHLGYRGAVDHYVGMSHYPRLAWDGPGQSFLAQATAPVLNTACMAWHSDFMTRAHADGLAVFPSVSFELLDAYSPADWKQRNHSGTPALTGYEPPSTLLAPTHEGAQTYLRDVAVAFLDLTPAGMARTVQIGEPWWWIASGPDATPCFYDAATTALYGAETGHALPEVLTRADAELSTAQADFVTWLSAKLAAATLDLCDGIKTAHPAADVSLLIYLPQIVNDSEPMRTLANLPAGWAFPAFDRLQLEDYEFVMAGDAGRHRRALAQVKGQLAYPSNATDYFAGFAVNSTARADWRLIDEAIEAAQDDGFGAVYVWASTQVLRDGFIHHRSDEEGAVSFHDVPYPLETALGSQIGPRFSTTVTVTASGFEQRNSNWAQARLEVDGGTGLRSEDDLKLLIDFFQARRGRAFAFRFRDPCDHATGYPVSPHDQVLGTGDGVTTQYALIKRYGTTETGLDRRITRPIAATLRVGLDGAELPSGWSLESLGMIRFETAPAPDVVVTAGFEFDVPMRFDSDQLSISLDTFRAGAVPSVPMVEVREA